MSAPKPTSSSLGSSPPTRLRIPEIAVSSELVKLGVKDRKLEAPADYDRAGWWHGGTRPGDSGPAVIAGHIDSVDGPAVFYRLSELDAGSVIEITREDGLTMRFAVDRVERHPKSDFPTDEVYGEVHRPELRLITCGGDFDRSVGHYEDNDVVFAHMISAA